MFGFVEELGDGVVAGNLLVAGGLGEGGDLGIEFVVAGRDGGGFGLGGPTGPTEEAGEAEAPGLEGDFGEGCASTSVIAVVFSHDGADGRFREAFEFLVAVCNIFLNSCKRNTRGKIAE